MSKEDIILHLNNGSKEFISFCSGIDDSLFFYQPADKWSISQNVTHLVTAANNTRLAFTLPKFIVRLYTGKPNRPSRTYDELVTKYKLKLSQGGRASGRFVPKPVLPSAGKEKTLKIFSTAMSRLTTAVQKRWNDPQLDRYIAPHPLLGKITLRELCYFTIYHTQHHLNIIKERVA
jgi:DinB superfamily